VQEHSRTIRNFDIISYYTGFIITGTAFLMLIPIIVSLASSEWSAMIDFMIGLETMALIGILMILLGRRTHQNRTVIQWKHGFVIAALVWIFMMVLCAVPYFLSGHLKTFLDACFDVMSGLTTTGLVMTQDLDHLSSGLNVWRHILTFIGGQGIVVLALVFMTKQTSGSYKLYVGEAKDIELVPSVKGTSKIIWKISMVYLSGGMVVLWITGLSIGLKPVSALFNAFYMFTSAWSTGGFAPMTQNIMYYHSVLYEIVIMVIFILGSFNFGLHYAIWQGKRKELVKNIETQSFFITSFLACMLVLFGLSKLNVYPNAVSGFRRVIFNVLSAHTTTGLQNVYARQFISDWGDFGIMIMIIIMLIGGSACSTAGGFKGLRVGIVFKGIITDIKKILTSERHISIDKYHHIKDQVLDGNVVKASSLIIICYMVLFSTGAIIGAFCGYPLADAAFESASVTGNVGLSVGITNPEMPVVLKIYFIIAMYMGRLEFISVFAMIGYVIGGIKKACAKH
jgi:trk system potassium uptake protein